MNRKDLYPRTPTVKTEDLVKPYPVIDCVEGKTASYGIGTSISMAQVKNIVVFADAGFEL